MKEHNATMATSTKVLAPPVVVIFLLVGLPAVLLDQISKLLIVKNFEAHRPQPLLGSWISIEVIRNPGAAFSLGEGLNWILVLVALIVIGWIAWVGRTTTRRAWQIAFGFIVGGATGNLIDRLIQPPGIGRGEVIDFINYKGFFVGNIADIFIVVGVCLVVIYTVLAVPLHHHDDITDDDVSCGDDSDIDIYFPEDESDASSLSAQHESKDRSKNTSEGM